jgi:hypothetical protein
MSLFQIQLLKETAQVDLIVGAIYIILASFFLLCIWHSQKVRRQLDKQNRQLIRRHWRKLNLRGLN